MKLAAKAFLAALFVSSSVYAIQYQLTPEETKMCEEGGGCIFAPMNEIRALAKEAYQAGYMEAKGQCGAARKKEI